MKPDLSFNTVISFMTNTNFQDYTGESGLSYLKSNDSYYIFNVYISSNRFCSSAAFIRGIIGRKKTLGNFFVDLIRIITRFLLPLSIIVTVILVCQGVPQTLSANKTSNYNRR